MATKVSHQPPEEELVNGVPREKYEWLTGVGEVVQQYVSSHKVEIDSPMAGMCQGHAFCGQAFLRELGVGSSVWMNIRSDGVPDHFVPVVDEGQAILDAYTAGRMDTWPMGDIIVCTPDSEIGKGKYHLKKLSEDFPDERGRPSTYQQLIDEIERVVRQDPPDLEELRQTNPYKT